MSMTDRTRQRVGIRKKGSDADNALGVSNFTVIKNEIEFSKAEEELLQTKGLTVEDDPWTILSVERKENILAPPYNPVQLYYQSVHNNTLPPCIDAMEVNVDGTGYDIEPKEKTGKNDQVQEKDPVISALKEFFDHPFPGESFMSLRRKMRRDRELTGNAYLEVIRNKAGEITMVNRLDAKLTRLLRLDAPVEVTKTITRNGKEMTVKMLVRERRFVQLIGTKVKYFREYGTSRHVDAKTGKWLEQVGSPAPTSANQKVAPTKVKKAIDNIAPPQPLSSEIPQAYSTEPEYGTEVIWFPLMPDTTTPYGVPRWIAQVPSVLGSRKAEELNLEFFESGGLPPVMILIQGGQMSATSKTMMDKYLGGKAKSKMRAVIADVYATGGDLAASNNVKVSVERFGSDRQSDSMFEKYDDKCSERIRSCFRLPPLFVGKSQDYSFATAYASYLIAEAQVFKPERDAFDEIVNNTIMKELAPEYVFRSLPLSVHDVNVQIQALSMLKDVTTRDSFVDEVNEVTGMNVEMLNEKDDPSHNLLLNQVKNSMPGKQPANGGTSKSPSTNLMRKDEDGETVIKDELFVQLAEDWAAMMSGDRVFEQGNVNLMKSIVHSFSPPVRKLFNAYVAMKLAPETKYDPDGIADLVACVSDSVLTNSH